MNTNTNLDKQIADAMTQIRIAEIDPTMIPYCIELLKTITDSEFDDFKWLAAVKNNEDQSDSLKVIQDLISIFENIMHVGRRTPYERADVNRIFSQLVNIYRLSRSLDISVINNTKFKFNLLRDEFLNPEYFPSPGYSQEGEDLILSRLLPRNQKGFFVDVGAHHPIRFSNTYFFYKHGWRGINIDPLPGSMDLFNRLRPRDINLEVAISSKADGEGFAKYIQFDEPALNALVIEGNDDVKKMYEQQDVVDIIDVPVKRLDDVLVEYEKEFDKIDLLNIDVELSELSVLETFTVQKYLPRIVVIEVKDFSFESRKEHPVFNYFVDNNYTLRSVLFNSIIFERQ